MKKLVVEFRIDNEVVVIEPNQLDLKEIEEIKWLIVSECDCKYDDIEVVFVELNDIYSDYDVTVHGLSNWLNPLKTFDSLKLNIPITSDEFLDAINENKVIDFIDFE